MTLRCASCARHRVQVARTCSDGLCGHQTLLDKGGTDDRLIDALREVCSSMSSARARLPCVLTSIHRCCDSQGTRKLASRQ